MHVGRLLGAIRGPGWRAGLAGSRCWLSSGHATALCLALLGPARRGMGTRRSACPSVARVSDHPDWDASGPKLMYVQVADCIAGRIASGALAPGAKLPAERDMASGYGVAYDTIRRATALLRERGLIATIVGRGTHVAERRQGSRLPLFRFCSASRCPESGQRDGQL